MGQLLQQKDTLAASSTGHSSLTAPWWRRSCNNMGSHLLGVIVCIALCGQITDVESVVILLHRVHSVQHTLLYSNILVST